MEISAEENKARGTVLGPALGRKPREDIGESPLIPNAERLAVTSRDRARTYSHVLDEDGIGSGSPSAGRRASARCARALHSLRRTSRVMRFQIQRRRIK